MPSRFDLVEMLMRRLTLVLGCGEAVAVTFHCNEIKPQRRICVRYTDITNPRESGLILSCLEIAPKGTEHDETAKHVLNAVSAPNCQIGFAE